MPSFAFRVANIEPRHDIAWIAAGEAVHRLYWQAVVGFVLIEKDAELAAGLDRFGKPLEPIAESTRARGRWRSHTGMGSADAPPLDPAYRLSRTRSLFTGRAHKDHAEFYWKRDEVTGLPWGKVLGWHRAGAGRLPVRDVIGLSPASHARVEAKADRWWASYKAGKLAEERARTFQLVQPTATPTRIVATGRIDLHNATFGIGGDGERARRAIDAGMATGFRQLGPKARPPKPAAVARPAPRPAAGRPPARTAASPRPDMSRKPAVPVPKPPVPKLIGPATPEQHAARFAEQVHEAVGAIPPEKLFGGDKAFIHHAYGLFKQRTGSDLSFAEFQRKLIEAHRKGLLELSRADMVEAMSAINVRLSNTHHMGVIFNFVRVRGR